MSDLLLRRRMMMAASGSGLPSEYTAAKSIICGNQSYAGIVIPNTTNANFGIYLHVNIPTSDASIPLGCFGYIRSGTNSGMGIMFPTNNGSSRSYRCLQMGEVTFSGSQLTLELNGDVELWLNKTDITTSGAYCKNNTYDSTTSLDFTVSNTDSSSYTTLNNEPIIYLGGTYYLITTVPFTNGSIYACKMYSNGSVVADLVPAMRNSDSVYGFYDLKQERFYPSVGSSAFSGSLT